MNLKSIICGVAIAAASLFTAARADAQVTVRVNTRTHHRHYTHHRRPVVVRERVVVRRPPVVRERVVVRRRPVVHERVVVHHGRHYRRY